MKDHLKKLLNQLDSIIEDHEEVGDTDVREQMGEAIGHGFIAPTPGYVIPSTFGMFTPEGDAAVRAAVSEFISAASRQGLSTAQEKLNAFQDPSVLSDAGHAYDEYFGHVDDLAQLESPDIPPPATAKRWWQFWK